MLDVVIIGGGPAGCAAAIRLAESGWRVRLHEKAQLPRPKLCGGFLSAESLPEFRELGVWNEVEKAGAYPIHRVLVSTPGGLQAVTGLDSPSYSLSRLRLDAILLERAKGCGVDVKENSDGLAHFQSSPWKVMASGRALPPSTSILNQGNRKTRWFYGFQAVFDDVLGITDQVELDLVPGGYVGLARQEDGVNVCGLVDLSTFRRAGTDMDSALNYYGRANPLLHGRIKSARRISPWKTVGPVIMGMRQLVQGNTLYTGDAACVVDPFAGEGIAMGLIAARVLRQAFAVAEKDRAQTYSTLWHERFDNSLRVQRMICWGIQYRVWQETLGLSCRLFPGLMRWLTNGTRSPAHVS